jgi:hypothetical protein
VNCWEKEIFPIDILNLSWTGWRLNPGVGGDRPMARRLRHGTAIDPINLNYIQRLSSYRAVNTCCLHYEYYSLLHCEAIETHRCIV